MERSRVVSTGMTVMRLIRHQSPQILLAALRYAWTPASGDVRRETGDRREETGVRRRETVDIIQETGNKRQKTRERSQETGTFCKTVLSENFFE